MPALDISIDHRSILNSSGLWVRATGDGGAQRPGTKDQEPGVQPNSTKDPFSKRASRMICRDESFLDTIRASSGRSIVAGHSLPEARNHDASRW